MDEREAAGRLAEAARQTVALGLNRGAEGNVSVRLHDGFLITPSGLPNAALTAEQMVYMSLDGAHRGALKPSSEWRLHRDLYRARPEVKAVVHAHSPYAVSLACLRTAIPPFHYMVAAAGGHDIPCAPYATFGTEALSQAVLTAMTDRKACLMANHGLVAVGASLTEALRLAEIVEELAAQYWRARLMGEPVLLTSEEMDEVLARFAGYGQGG
ncbi:MAG: class II aldolase/adducin family protein [Thiobacillaceae bacterium]|nr:class II aldolase/adducin family protein [Thiobacillaceae bacterium]MDW8324910.1 class II aldolase/adducin family protein [Burkholderiales bacterium]